MTGPRRVLQTARGGVWHGCALAVASQIEAGSVRAILSDGPYNMGKAKGWDWFATWQAFRDWYAPHLAEWGRIAAPDAVLWVWGTDESLYHLRPAVEAAGWAKVRRVVWDKRMVGASLGGAGLPDTTESADVYARGAATLTHVLHLTRTNNARRAGLRPRPCRCSNVWTMHPANGGAGTLVHERLRGDAPDRDRLKDRTAVAARPVHDCQKPIEWFRRMVLSSSDPGDLIFEPFGGTCRAAAAIEAMPHSEARRYVVAEIDNDGRDYLAHAVPDVCRIIGKREGWGGA